MFKKESSYNSKITKLGLASLLVSTSLLGAHLISADETENTTVVEAVPTNNTTTSVSISEELSSPIKEALDEYDTKTQTPVTTKDTPEVGDVVGVEANMSDVTESTKQIEDSTVTTEEATATVKTTTIAAPEEPIGKQKPVTTTKQATFVEETDDATITRNEKVTKTVTVEVVKEADTVTTQNTNADIVFVIDHSFSMLTQIQAVKDNIKSFVNDLSKRQVMTRLGLVSYVSEEDTVYFDFNNSNFTSDANEFIKALDSIVIGGDIEKPTIPLSHIANNYDWSTDVNTKRFTVLITDEGADFSGVATPSMEQTLQSLKNTGISLTVIGLALYDDYNTLIADTDGLWVDIDEDFSSILSEDISNWVIETVYEGQLLKIVTEEYTFFVETTITPKSLPTLQTFNPNVKVTCPVVYKLTPANSSVETQVPTLPKTGTQEKPYFSILGLTSIALATAVAFYRDNRKKS